MRSHHWLALSVVALTPTASIAQTSDLARSLTQLVDSVVTTNKQRKTLLELSTPLAYRKRGVEAADYAACAAG